MHRSKCVLSQFPNLFFMKLMMLNVYSSSTKPSTWTTTILANLIYSES